MPIICTPGVTDAKKILSVHVVQGCEMSFILLIMMHPLWIVRLGHPTSRTGAGVASTQASRPELRGPRLGMPTTRLHRPGDLHSPDFNETIDFLLLTDFRIPQSVQRLPPWTLHLTSPRPPSTAASHRQITMSHRHGRRKTHAVPSPRTSHVARLHCSIRSRIGDGQALMDKQADGPEMAARTSTHLATLCRAHIPLPSSANSTQAWV